MTKHKPIEAMGNLTIEEKFREEFIRVLKYGLAHVSDLDKELRDLLSKWIKEEEDKISRFEGVLPEEETEEQNFMAEYTPPFGGESN